MLSFFESILHDPVNGFEAVGERRWLVETVRFAGRGDYISHEYDRFSVTVTRKGAVKVRFINRRREDVPTAATIERIRWQEEQMAKAEQTDTAPRVRCHVPGESCSLFCSEVGVRSCESRIPEDWNQRCAYQE